MKIKKLILKNFRNIEDASQTFDSHFTVLIGINGAGKSTWLNGLRVACGTFFMGIPVVKSRHINLDEMRAIFTTYLQYKSPVLVQAEGHFLGQKGLLPDEPLVWRRQILEGTIKTTSSHADVGVIRDLGKEKYNQTNNGIEPENLPVIAYFGTSRVFGAARNRDSKIGRNIFKDGYHSWDEMRSSTYQYSSWLSNYDPLVSSGHEHVGTKAAFFEAIKTAIPYIQRIEFNQGRLWIEAKLKGKSTDFLPIHMHSDGLLSFTEMVAELAYRCIMLNGYLGKDVIKGSHGIVMIDELDLHLHPTWQQHVVSDLKKAFPNIQFVATTHSPFIVQSLKKEELINLDTEDGLEKDPKMYSLEEVSEQEMGVPFESRHPEFLEMVESAKRYFSLIKEGKTSKSDADVAALRARLNELEDRFSDDPAFVATLQLERESSEL